MEQKLEYCINFCELQKNIKAQGKSIQEYVEEIGKRLGINEIARLYIGSYFCSHYFLHLSDNEFMDMITYAKESNSKLTLVLPVFTEITLQAAKRRIDKLSREFEETIDEITVNDYGMLVYIASKYRVRINLGRLLMKDYRDPRYPEYFNQTRVSNMFTPHLAGLVKKYKINRIEFDPTHAAIDVEKRPEKVGIAVHAPYCYMTTGQICEYASIDHVKVEKFRPNMSCNTECMDHHIEYEMEGLEPPRKFIRFGRTVYFKNEDCKVIGTDDLRIIYFPID